MNDKFLFQFGSQNLVNLLDYYYKLYFRIKTLPHKGAYKFLCFCTIIWKVDAITLGGGNVALRKSILDDCKCYQWEEILVYLTSSLINL